MFAFVAYAVAVWYAAAKWRRRWQSFAWVAAGFLGLVGVAWFHYKLNIWTHGRICLPILRSMLYPYTAIVVVMGVYIACLPRAAALARCCHACRYDLAGLPLATRCPECGADNSPPARVRSESPQEWFNPVEPKVTRAGAARSTPPEAHPPAAPRWPGVAEPAACLRSEDQ